ncbi:MAG: hypothetical protein JST23_00815 [Bacteroidetes bacterium]|nr:hypothetical protein [Bacteroidota bacterium]
MKSINCGKIPKGFNVYRKMTGLSDTIPSGSHVVYSSSFYKHATPSELKSATNNPSPFTSKK